MSNCAGSILTTRCNRGWFGGSARLGSASAASRRRRDAGCHVLPEPISKTICPVGQITSIFSSSQEFWSPRRETGRGLLQSGNHESDGSRRRIISSRSASRRASKRAAVRACIFGRDLRENASQLSRQKTACNFAIMSISPARANVPVCGPDSVHARTRPLLRR
jgi:hypothetical protein